MSAPWPAEVAHLPVCPRRKLPIPYIAGLGEDGTGHFTILDHGRAAECLAGRLCAMCGLPMGDEVALLGDEVALRPDGFFIEPPVHERCAEIAAGGLCPFLSRQHVPRRPPEDDTTVVGDGRDELPDVGRFIAKRPVIMVITRAYQPALVAADTGSPVVVYLAGRVERVRRYRWDENGRLAELGQGMSACPVQVARTQPRRQSREQRRHHASR